MTAQAASTSLARLRLRPWIRGTEWFREGKSNFFDALEFGSLLIRNGVETALRAHGGFADIHSEERYEKNARKFGFEIECDLPEKERWTGEEDLFSFYYSLTIHDLDQKFPNIEEHIHKNGVPLLAREKDDDLTIKGWVYRSVPQDLFGAAVLHRCAVCSIAAITGEQDCPAVQGTGDRTTLLGLDKTWLSNLLDGGLPWRPSVSWSRDHPMRCW